MSSERNFNCTLSSTPFDRTIIKLYTVAKTFVSGRGTTQNQRLVAGQALLPRKQSAREMSTHASPVRQSIRIYRLHIARDKGLSNECI